MGASRNTKGFTLLELLIVLVILGIMASLAVPAFLAQRNRAYRQEALESLQTFRASAARYFVQNGGVYDNSVANAVTMNFALTDYNPTTATAGQTLSFGYALGPPAPGPTTYTAIATCIAALPCAGLTVTINAAGVVGGTLT